MELDMWHALEDGRFSLVFQPQVRADGTLVGAEALLRWTCLNGMSESPAKFIHVAEESGLIHSIGEWVIETCFATLSRWHGMDLPKLSLAINLSPVQLEHPDGRLVAFVSERLEHYRIPPEMIEFELTETAVYRDPEVVHREINRLAKIGFGLAIDDFGTGYSSLQVLQRLPFNKLKIDRCFVDPLLQRAADRTIVHATILMAKRLGLCTVAEGVGQFKQVDLLAELGCDLFQGFLYGRPVAADLFEDLLRRGATMAQEQL